MNVERVMRLILAVSMLLSAFVCATANAERIVLEVATPLPAFTHPDAEAWLNSSPLTVTDLRGKPALVHVWTFECWNCYRSFPWLADVVEQYTPRGVVAVGIHTPEFDREKVRTTIAAKTREFGIDHPIMIDNDYSYWRALQNQYWPTWYLVDAHGQIRLRVVGEIHAGDPRARAIEAALDALLVERAAPANERPVTGE
jgi:thiol-disulfide isomerase/thioredoxin